MIRIERIPRDEYERLESGFGVYPFLAPFWLESFTRRQLEQGYFAFYRKEDLVGLAAGLLVTSGLKILKPISRYIYLYGLPEIRDQEPTAVFDEFKRYLKRIGCNAVNIAPLFSPNRYDLKTCGFKSQLNEEFVIDLSPPLADLWENLSKHEKRKIKKAEKEGLVFEESQNVGKWEDLIGCLGETRQRKSEKGFGEYDYHYITFMNDAVIGRMLKSTNARIYNVHHLYILSACLVVRNHQHAYCLFAGTTPEGYHLNSARFMFWKLIETIKEDGCRSLNLAGLPKDETASHLAEFKRSLGGEPRTCEGGNCSLSGNGRFFLHKAYRYWAKFVLPKLRKKTA